MDLFDVKQDVIKTLVEAGFDQNKLYIDGQAPSYYHPGKSGRRLIRSNKIVNQYTVGMVPPGKMTKCWKMIMFMLL